MSMRMGPRGFLTEEEQQNKPKVTKELIFRIFSYLKPYWYALLAVLIIIVISSVLGLLPSIITGKIIDEAIVGKDFAKLVKLVLLALITLTASQVISVFESYINGWVSERIVYDMKNQMFQHLQTMEHSFFTSEKQGDIITRMNSDISGVSSAISQTLTSCISKYLYRADYRRSLGKHRFQTGLCRHTGHTVTGASDQDGRQIQMAAAFPGPGQKR